MKPLLIAGIALWELSARPPHGGKRGKGSSPSCIIISFWNNTMEAEQLNAVINQLDDLDHRAIELRRYL